MDHLWDYHSVRANRSAFCPAVCGVCRQYWLDFIVVIGMLDAKRIEWLDRTLSVDYRGDVGNRIWFPVDHLLPSQIVGAFHWSFWRLRLQRAMGSISRALRVGYTLWAR